MDNPRLTRNASLVASYSPARCRVEPYWIKSAALRAAVPAALAPGCGPGGPTRRGTAGTGLQRAEHGQPCSPCL